MLLQRLEFTFPPTLTSLVDFSLFAIFKDLLSFSNSKFIYSLFESEAESF